MRQSPPSAWPVPGFACGADWNPDQWPREVWLRDLELMRTAGVNLVTLPVFAWASLEPAEGKFDFGWLDEILDATHAAGIKVDLATGTATPPAWLVRKHPEVLPVNQAGVRLEYGSRQSYCLTATVFVEGTRRLAAAMAEQYAAHPAVVMWHISNEYGDHVTRCYCDNCATAFRDWLRARYGNIEGLNAVWGTKMWGQTYYEFGEINPPRQTMAPANPSHTLDYARFATDAINRLYEVELAAIREHDTVRPATTNFMTIGTDVDYWQLADRLDLVSFDNYPDPADPYAQLPAALNYGAMRSLAKRRPWLLLESATSAVSWREVNVPKSPGQNRAHSYQAVAHGSDAVMYFQWRASQVGAERFHSAIVGHIGESSRTLAETSRIWHELGGLAEVTGSRVRSSVALVMDWQSRWAMTGPETMPSLRLQWLAQQRCYHEALTRLGLTVDAIHPESALGDYRAVIAPSQFLLSAGAADGWERFVAAGGTLVVGPFSAVVDQHNHVHQGGAPGPLAELLGVRVEEPWPLADGDATSVKSAAGEISAHTWTEWLQVAADTEVLATYATGPLAGRPAVTRRIHGQGSAVYISAAVSAADLATLLGPVLAGLPMAPRDPAIEVVTRTSGEADYTFVINHGQTPVRITLKVPATALIGDVSRPLSQFDVVVLRSESADQTLQQVQVVEVVK